ncbi:MAG TPA: hypothetical protein VFG53_18290 [Anaeromyxobacter sp.]|nr:hypothetical protein [Anaeromyxobacter sp.]
MARESALLAVESALSVRLPRSLFAHGARAANVDPEALLEADGGTLQGGRMPPDTLPVAIEPSGDGLLLRFDGWGEVIEVLDWSGDGAFHPTELLPEFRSAPARSLAEARAALHSGLGAMCEVLGRNALARDLGVNAEVLAGWLRDTRLVPESLRAALRRLSGRDDDALFRQDWNAAVAAARRVAPVRPDLAWPGLLAGYAAEGRGDGPTAAAGYRAVLLAESGTQAFREPGRTLEESARFAAEAWRRCAVPARDPEPMVAAALEGPAAVRAHHLAECDRLIAAGRAAEAYFEARRAGWRRHLPVDMDDVLGRMGEAAQASGAVAHAALARLHLRAWMATR